MSEMAPKRRKGAADANVVSSRHLLQFIRILVIPQTTVYRELRV
jgi:hypothetical protein